MKLLINGDRIAGTAADEYTGPMAFIPAPEDYDPTIEYQVVGGVLTIPVPQSITPRQARLALLGVGLLDQVQAAMDALDEPTKTAALIEWEYAVSIERGSAWVANMAGALGLTAEQLDDLFRQASQL